jgi:hypothetical protein
MRPENLERRVVGRNVAGFRRNIGGEDFASEFFGYHGDVA